MRVSGAVLALELVLTTAMKTVETFESLRSALREKEEVVVLTSDATVRTTLFVNNHNVSLSSSGGNWLDGLDGAQLLVITGESDVLLEDLGFRRGFSSGSGGAVSILGGATVEIVRCTITSSSADVGGAVYVSTSTLTLVESAISSNAARFGGAVYSSESTVEVADSTLSSNDGGALVATQSSHVDCKRSVFEENRKAQKGGAAIHVAKTSVVTASECVFRSNAAGGAPFDQDRNTLAVGGHVALDASTAALTKSIFEAGTADKGGAVAVTAGSSLTTAGCTFTKNAAQLGGAIAVEDHGDWTDTGSAIVDNSADMEGGGAYVTAESTFSSKHTKFSNNFPDQSFAFLMPPGAAPTDFRRGRRILSLLAAEDDQQQQQQQQRLSSSSHQSRSSSHQSLSPSRRRRRKLLFFGASSEEDSLENIQLTIFFLASLLVWLAIFGIARLAKATKRRSSPPQDPGLI